MKQIGILSAFFAVVTAAVAQTGTNAPAGRAMSLADCIQAALAHNFDVQIQRFNPQISLYNLNAAYSGYDPTFSASGAAQLQRVAQRLQSEFDQLDPVPDIGREQFQLRHQRHLAAVGIAIQFERQRLGTIRFGRR